MLCHVDMCGTAAAFVSVSTSTAIQITLLPKVVLADDPSFKCFIRGSLLWFYSCLMTNNLQLLLADCTPPCNPVSILMRPFDCRFDWQGRISLWLFRVRYLEACPYMENCWGSGRGRGIPWCSCTWCSYMWCRQKYCNLLKAARILNNSITIHYDELLLYLL